MTGYLNEGIRSLQPYAKLPGETTIPLVTDTAAYDLPVDFYTVGTVVWTDAEGEEHELSELTPPMGNRLGYRIRGSQIIVNPAPSDADPGTLAVYYEVKLTELEDDDDEPNLPSEWHDLPFLFLMKRIEEQDDEPQRAVSYAQEYAARLRSFIGRPRRFDTATRPLTFAERGGW